MQIGSFIAIYFIMWWLTFVMVLPIGNQSHHEVGAKIVAGSDPGAPIKPRLWLKAGLTTLLSAAFTALLLWGVSNETLQQYWNR